MLLVPQVTHNATDTPLDLFIILTSTQSEALISNSNHVS